VGAPALQDAGDRPPPFPRLFSPITIGPLTARNRVVLGAHFTLFSEPNATWGEPGLIGARYGRYLGDRARGGVGVVIAGQAHVHPTTAYQMLNNSAAWREESVPQFEEASHPIREQGALAFLQISHNGAAAGTGAWSKQVLVAPSGHPVRVDNPKTLDKSEIRELVDHYARSAHNAVRGGFQGIELHGAHGYLINQFLSPVTNQRTDEYGGGLDNRLRFLVEVLEEVRSRVGPGVAVGVRLVGDEERPNGIRAQDAAEMAALLEERALVDFVNVSIGQTGAGMIRPLYVKHEVGVYAAATVKEALTHTPVFAVQRILTPEEAEGILERGEADAITVVRALIADPEWAVKAAAGHSDEIRLCTGCNQSCYNHLVMGLPMACAHNPAVGREAELGLGTLSPAHRSKLVVVVGGGPAGLEAAWVAAARGHRVVLFERETGLGGKVRLAQKLPGRTELADFADWRIAECRRQGVELRLGVEADAALVADLRPDLVVIATGGDASTAPPVRLYPEPPVGWDLDVVLDHELAVAQPDRVGSRVVVFDTVGHVEGCGLAELLAATGREVTLAMPYAAPTLLDPESLGHALGRAVRAGARWRPNTLLERVTNTSAALRDLLGGGTEEVPIDTVVIRTWGRPREALYLALLGRVPELVRVGDAVAPRTVDRAIFDGHRAGRKA
jgi:2,4-dienoyl-CoA reductase-like NADH-dependent reductase (Old Yellow Enzyme family)